MDKRTEKKLRKICQKLLADGPCEENIIAYYRIMREEFESVVDGSYFQHKAYFSERAADAEEDAYLRHKLGMNLWT